MRKSAGILMYRNTPSGIEVLLVHPGGPFWAKKDEGVWSLPKGEFSSDEDALAAAKREFLEETGFPVDGDFIALAPLKQPSGKTVYAWAVEGDLDAGQVVSNTFLLEWPPRSGRQIEIPEIDRAEWTAAGRAKIKLCRGQAGFVDELMEILKNKEGERNG